jgi:hypothetical protein
MPDSFPRLKTGALAQYPTVRVLARPVEALRFLDMSRQVYLDSRNSLRSWRLQLNLLDESELAAVTEFFTAMRGSLGRFAFEDPATGEVVENCRFDDDELVLFSSGEFNGKTMLTVRESR